MPLQTFQLWSFSLPWPMESVFGHQRLHVIAAEPYGAPAAQRRVAGGEDDPCRFSRVHAIQNRSQRQQTARLRRILRPPRMPAKINPPPTPKLGRRAYLRPRISPVDQSNHRRAGRASPIRVNAFEGWSYGAGRTFKNQWQLATHHDGNRRLCQRVLLAALGRYWTTASRILVSSSTTSSIESRPSFLYQT